MKQKTIEKVNKTNKPKSLFFEKMNKIYKPLAEFTKTKRDKTQINKINSNREHSDLMEIKVIRRE